MAVGGAFFLLFAALMGGDHEVHVDHDVDGGADHGDHESGQGHHFLSFKVIAAFCTLFGAAGTIAKVFDLNNLGCLAIATLSGVIGSIAVDALLVFLYKQQSNSAFSAASIKGQQGSVLMAIQPGKWGEVSVVFRGSTFTNRAKALDPSMEIAQGTPVEVVFADATGYVVKPL